MKKFLIGILIVSAFLLGGGDVFAQTPVPTTEDLFKAGGSLNLSENIDSIKDYTLSTIQKENQRDTSQMQNQGAKYFSNAVSIVIQYIKRLLVPVTILFTVWAGLTLILSSGQEEEFDRRKRMVYAAFFGWLILLTAVILVDNIFFGVKGEIFRETTNTTLQTFAQRAVSELQGLFKYLITFAVAVGTTFVLFSAFKLILAGGEEEAQISNIKKRIVYTTGGMVLLVSAEKLVSFFTTTIQGSDVLKLSTPDITKTIRLIVDWGNFFLGLIGTVAVMMLVWGGIRLIANFGVDEQAIENAKKTLIAAAIGLILAFSAWTIMYFLLVHDGSIWAALGQIF